LKSVPLTDYPRSTVVRTGDLMDIPASGKQVSVVNHAFARIVDGKIAEWSPSSDTIGPMRQIGVIASQLTAVSIDYW
jgi:hypothetical protein